jgi:adenylylsulfate reductase subunit A
MTISQCGIWAGENIEPDKTPSEIMPTEPYLLGSHAGCAGIWVSGPTDIPGVPKEWNWGYNRMTTVKGLFTGGDGVGASGHKFSSGSFAEGRIAAKAMVKFALDNKDWKPEMARTRDELVEEIYRPVRTFLQHKDYTTAIDINPHYITPKQLQFRLQKIMDEYVGGVATFYQTNAKMLEMAEKKLLMIREDSLKMRAKDLHELLRAWENYHRIIAAEAHMRHIQFRQETRYPGYYYRTDYNYIDDDNWKCFVNSRYDRNTGSWELKKVPYKQLIKD